MLAELESKGVRLFAIDGKLVVETEQPLTDEQREFLKTHKPAIVHLAKAADHYGCDLADLLSWYRDDLEMVATMPSKDLAWAIEDYLRHRVGLYRRSYVAS